MKKITTLFIIVFSITCYAQELKKNPDTGKFGYVEIIQNNRNIDLVEERLKDLNYSEIVKKDNSIIAKSLINEQVMGFVVEIFYKASLEFKEDRYLLEISNVVVKDTKGSYVLEDMGSYQKKWLKKFNERLPEIVLKLKMDSKKNDW